MEIKSFLYFYGTADTQILMHNDEKLSNILLISRGLNTTRFLKYVCLFFIIMYGRFERKSKSPYSVRIGENAGQKKLRVWTLFTQ